MKGIVKNPQEELNRSKVWFYRQSNAGEIYLILLSYSHPLSSFPSEHVIREIPFELRRDSAKFNTFWTALISKHQTSTANNVKDALLQFNSNRIEGIISSWNHIQNERRQLVHTHMISLMM
eukprot:TRINITY_DN3470_c0_g1_i4.p1 TRINITY_DN3470_c0_g1~~TRINITY_DN3470_c0_g1_i4.p1  ORF type:complete len:121 (+),score=13.32 TRINITY_DN3470_c0_g1_i4:252-614(+)